MVSSPDRGLCLLLLIAFFPPGCRLTDLNPNAVFFSFFHPLMHVGPPRIRDWEAPFRTAFQGGCAPVSHHSGLCVMGVSPRNRPEVRFACCLGDKSDQDGPRAADATETSSRNDAKV